MFHLSVCTSVVVWEPEASRIWTWQDFDFQLSSFSWWQFPFGSFCVSTSETAAVIFQLLLLDNFSISSLETGVRICSNSLPGLCTGEKTTARNSLPIESESVQWCDFCRHVTDAHVRFYFLFVCVVLFLSSFAYLSLRPLKLSHRLVNFERFFNHRLVLCSPVRKMDVSGPWIGTAKRRSFKVYALSPVNKQQKIKEL